MKKILFIIALAFCFSAIYAQKDSKNEGTPLRETFWFLKAIDGQNIAATNGNEAYIVFDPSNTYYGNLGCNSFFGKYSASSKKIKLRYTGATKKLCPDMSTEEIFLKAQKAPITHYTINGNTLTLYVQGKEYMRFEAGANPNKGDKANINSIETEENDFNDKGERETQREDSGENLGE
ncbi:MAG: META domain-containing protein [Bacteroidales bacterium]|nr:META domain-containing protein [Bacteroidales bacterium]